MEVVIFGEGGILGEVGPDGGENGHYDGDDPKVTVLVGVLNIIILSHWASS